jgi:hypothetical protein
MMTLRRTGKSGHYILELSLVLPIFLTLVFATFDLVSIFRASSSLQAGLDTAARCLYPLEAGCRREIPAQSAGRYDLYRENRSTDYFIPDYTYSVRESSLRIPVYAYPEMRAAILNTLEYEVPGLFFHELQNFYPARREISYVLQSAGLPVISGDALNPDLRPQKGVPLAPRRISLASIHGRSSAGSRRLGTISFELPAPPEAQLPCYPTQATASGAEATRNFEARCPDTPSRRLAAVLFIRGKRDSLPGAHGAIEISLEGGGERIPLGGRRLDYAPGLSDGNFVPRGSPLESISPATASGYSEFASYQNLRLLHSVPYRLHFDLRNESGEPGWSGEELEIYFPRYDTAREYLDCTGGVTIDAEGKPFGCPVPAGMPAGSPIELLSETPLRQIAVSAHCGAVSDTRTPIEALIDGSHFELDAYTLLPDSSVACPVAQRSLVCASPEAMNGVGELPENGYIRRSASALAACPPLLSDLGVAENLRWKEKVIQPPEAGKFLWRQETCAESQPPSSELPPALQRYAKLTLGSATLAGREKRCPGLSTPEILRDTPRFSCPEILLTDEPWRPEIMRSLASAIESCEWEESLRERAHSAGFDPGCGYQSERILIGERRSSTPPEGRCTEFRTGYRSHGPPELVGENLDEGAARELCARVGENCRMERTASSYDGPSSELSIEDALTLAYREASSFLPGLRRDCSAPGCVTFSARRDGSEITLSAEMAAPRTWILPGSRTIRKSVRRRLEGSLNGERR